MLKVKIFVRSTLLCLILTSTQSVFASEADIVIGKWLSEKKDGVIQIVKRKGKYMGYLVWIKRIADGKKKASEVLDTNNPNPKQQKRQLLGIKLFGDFKYDDGEWNDGEIYDPSSGKTYKSYLKLDGKNTLKLRGYIGIPMFGKTSVWTRHKGKTLINK